MKIIPGTRRGRILLLIITLSILFCIAISTWILFISKFDQPPQKRSSYNLKSALDNLATLPYVSTTSVDENTKNLEGVTRSDKSKAYPGINIYMYDQHPGAKFLNMDGEIVYELIDRRQKPSLWKLVEQTISGDFIVLSSQRSLMKIDLNSNIIWETNMFVHHDIDVTDSEIYTLINMKRAFISITFSEKIVDNLLVIVDQKGQTKKAISFAEMFVKNNRLLELIKNDDHKEYRYGKDAWDVMHTNAVAVLREDWGAQNNSIFKQGNVLFCMRHLDIIGIIDLKKEEIIWHWGSGILDNPHDPSFLDNGNIL